MFLKDNQLEYLEETRIKDLVNKLFEFISHPIYMWTENKIGDVDEDKDKGSKIKEVEISHRRNLWVPLVESIIRTTYLMILHSPFCQICL